MRNNTQHATERGNVLAARTGFVCSGAAFVACGLEVVVDHALLDSLLVSATAAIGLLALALGLFTSGWCAPSAIINVVVTAASTDPPATGENHSPPAVDGPQSTARTQDTPPPVAP